MFSIFTITEPLSRLFYVFQTLAQKYHTLVKLKDTLAKAARGMGRSSIIVKAVLRYLSPPHPSSEFLTGQLCWNRAKKKSPLTNFALIQFFFVQWSVIACIKLSADDVIVTPDRFYTPLYKKGIKENQTSQWRAQKRQRFKTFYTTPSLIVGKGKLAHSELEPGLGQTQSILGESLFLGFFKRGLVLFF